MPARKHFVLILLLSFGLQLALIFKQYCGNFYWILWPSSYFSHPAEISDRNGGPFFLGESKALVPIGWDGQFYFRVATDPLMATEDYQAGIDYPSYRYQRVGLSLVTKLTSTLFGQTIVSPFLYWLVNNLIWASALFLLSDLFFLSRIPQYYLWLWGFGVGTQSVLMHGLPDAFADSMFIATLYFLLRNNWFICAVVSCLCVLSRESYSVVYGTMFGLWLLIKCIPRKHKIEGFGLVAMNGLKKFEEKAWVFMFPCLSVVGWQIYIYLKTGQRPSAGMWGLYMDLPLRSAIGNLTSIYGIEVLMTSFFIVVILYLLWRLVEMKRNVLPLAIIPLVIIVSSMGPGAFTFYRDYLKGLSPLLVILPFFMERNGQAKAPFFKKIILALLVLQPILYFSIKYKERGNQRACVYSES